MKVFALRQIGTNKFMPARKGRGYSNDEPIENGGELGPRLFFSRIGARNALSQWRRGSVERRTIDDGFDYDEVLRVVPKPHRAALDIEIVEFDLIEVGK